MPGPRRRLPRPGAGPGARPGAGPGVLLGCVLVALLVLYAAWQRTPYYLDAALVLSLLAFIATLVLARFHGEGQVF